MPTTSTTRRDVAQRTSSRGDNRPVSMAEGSSTASGQVSESSRPVSYAANGAEEALDERHQSKDSARRRLFRHSGGFILDPTDVRKRSVRRNLQSGEGKQSKQKSRDHDTSPPQPRSVSERFHTQGGGAQSSPLQEGHTSYSPDSSTLNGGGTTQDGRGNGTRSASSQTRQNGSSRDHLDSESADIVNLALSLNENRRRWFQTSTANDATHLPAKQRASSGLFEQPFLAEELQNLSASRATSGQYASNNGVGTTSRLPISTTEIVNRLSHSSDLGGDDGAFHERVHPNFRGTVLSNSSIIPSEATMQRVQKAKTALELAYQHRRLLQHLPELPAAPASLKRPTSSRNDTNTREEIAASGRRYNPLQYIRNRRMRFREGCPLNPEAAGWNDVERVEDWIGRVADQRTRLAPTEKSKFPLPHFPGSGPNPDAELEVQSPASVASPVVSPTSKPVRPRSDWETNPWSMLADIYWTSKEEHQGLLEDQHGDKLYPRAPRGKPQAAPRVSLDLAPRTTQSSTTRPNDTDATSNRHAQVREIPSYERGRASRRTREANGQVEHYSSSSDRRPKWPRKILRSESDSSSEDEFRSAAPNSAVHRRMDGKNLQERALFERQLRALQAQETGDPEGKQSLDLEPADRRKPSLAVSPDSSAREQSRSRRHLRHSHKAKTWAVEAKRGHRKDKSRAETFDSTAPSSPEHRQSVPNITINLTPPHNEKLPTFKRRALPQRSILAEVEKGLHKMHVIDPIAPTSSSKDESRPDSIRGALPDVKEINEPTSPTKSPRADTQRAGKPIDTSSRTLTEPKETDSRLRGLVRGARIAELVASPVTRVADLIWRREETEMGKNSSSSYDSLPMPAEKSPDKIGMQREASRSDSDVSIESVATAPGYHISNLPVFKSPFAENRPVTPVSKHDKLPRLDTRSPPDNQQRDTKSGPLSPQNERSRFANASPARSAERDASADDKERQHSSGRRLAVVDPFVDGSIQGSMSPSSAQHDSPGHGHRRWASLDSQYNFDTLDLPPSTLKVTLDHVARLKVVQLSCTIRASEMARKAAKVSSTTTEETAALQKSTGAVLYNIPDVEQQLYTGGLMAKAIDLELEAAKNTATRFSSETVTALHERLNALHGQISDDLTHMARSAEKGADELSAQLATDCTLDIKRLNETLDLIMRRRRRRMRWVRRAGFAALEWMVLITLWLLWLIVFFIRLARGTVRIGVSTAKWLLWL